MNRTIHFSLILATALVFVNPLAISGQIKSAGTNVYVRSDQHQPINGFIWLNNGAFLKGKVEFVTKVSETYPTDSKGNKSTKPVKNFYIKGYSMNGQTFKPEDVFMYGTTDERFVKDFLKYDKKGAIKPSNTAHENFHKGYIIDSNGNKADGFIAVIASNYVVDHVLFAETMNGPVSVFYQQPQEFHRPYNLRHVVQEVDGAKIEHFPTVSGFAKRGDGKKYKSVSITLPDGTKLSGKGELGYKNWDYGMNYNQLLVFESSPNELIQSFSPAVGTELHEVIVDGEEYLAFDNGFYPKAKIIKKLTKAKNNDEKNFQPGYIMFNDGTKKELRIARARKVNRGFYTLDGNGQFKAYYGDPKVAYFTQNIDGQEVRYRRIKKRYEVWHQPESDFSYCVNPYPTHIRKGLTKFVQGVTSAAVEIATDELIEAAAEKAIREGGNIRSVVDNAIEMDEGLTVDYSSTEGGIYHDEYIIFMKSGKAWIVYTKNIDEFISSVLTNCDNFSSIEKKNIRQLGNIDKLDETITYLNQNGCSN